jgi:DNA-binding IclR family transcriptional regulator
MEGKAISQHEVRIMHVLGEGRWLGTREIAELAGVAPRTARAHALSLVRLGILDQEQLSPGYRYRLSPYAASRNLDYMQRLAHATEIFGRSQQRP